MRQHLKVGILLATVACLVAPVFADMDTDDSVLVEQIDASVHQYRTVLADYTQLQTTLKATSGKEDVSNLPAILDYIQSSMDPADRSLRELLTRYRHEYGERALAKLAQHRGFADLLKTN